MYLECDTGYFGHNCEKKCGNCGDPQSCHNVDGTCLTGCAPGYDFEKSSGCERSNIY